MAKAGNSSAKVQKLESNVKKLKAKVEMLTKKLKSDADVSKKKLLEAKNQMAVKVEEAQAKGFDKGLNEALKLQEAKDKAIAAATAKFDKEWQKKQAKSVKSKKASKKKAPAKKKAVAKKKAPAKKVSAKATKEA